MTDELETNCVYPPIKSCVKLREPELNWSWSVSSGNPGQINVSERIKGQVALLFHCGESLFDIAFKFQRLRFTQRFVLLHSPQNLWLQAEIPPFPGELGKLWRMKVFFSFFWKTQTKSNYKTFHEHSEKFPFLQAASTLACENTVKNSPSLCTSGSQQWKTWA